jgi:hypothetical protein
MFGCIFWRRSLGESGESGETSGKIFQDHEIERRNISTKNFKTILDYSSYSQLKPNILSLECEFQHL